MAFVYCLCRCFVDTIVTTPCLYQPLPARLVSSHLSQLGTSPGVNNPFFVSLVSLTRCVLSCTVHVYTYIHVRTLCVSKGWSLPLPHSSIPLLVWLNSLQTGLCKPIAKVELASNLKPGYVVIKVSNWLHSNLLLRQFIWVRCPL